mgnify:CR=1 FL=1|jgi:hypothetical protein
MSAETYARLQEVTHEHMADEEPGAMPGAWVLAAETTRVGSSPEEDETAMQYVYHGSYFSALGLLVQAQRTLGADEEDQQ